MKKTLVAVAALAATGAFADVTLSGNLNQGYTTTTVNGASPSKTTSLSAASNSSFITFSGSESLESTGLKASFKVEQGLGLNSATANLFTTAGLREGWIALGGAFGTVTAGAQYTTTFNNVVGTDPNGFNNIAGWGPGVLMALNTNAQLAHVDTITYALPSFVEGVGISVQSFRPDANSNGSGALVNYSHNGLYAGYSQQTTGADRATSGALSYDFGVAKISYSNIDSTAGATKTTDSTYGITVPVSSAATLGLSAGTYNTGGTKTNNSQFGAYYNLSKRTQAYAIYGKASAAASTTTTAVGINHAF